MGVPSVKLSIEDGALGLQGATGEQDIVLFGTCTGGVSNVAVAVTSADKATELLGYGPLAECAAYVAERSGRTVWCVPVAQSGAGTMGTWSTSPTTGPAVGNTGTPNDAYQVWVKITGGGAIGTSRFQFSLDGGDNYEPEAVTAATYALTNTGITLTFAAGTYVLGEVYKCNATPPAYTSVQIAAAVDAWRASGFVAKALGDVGVPASAAGGATIAGTYASKADAMEQAGDYVAVLLQAADDTLPNLVTAYAAVASKREGIAATFCKLQSPSGRSYRRPFAWVVFGEFALRKISEDLGKVRRGAIPGIVSIEHDEESDAGYGDAKFIVPRRVKKRAGFYVSDPVMRSPSGSDFDLLQMRRVMDVACDATRNALTDYLNDDLETQPADPNNPAVGGTLDPAQAAAIDTDIQAAVTAAVVTERHATFSAARVNRTDKILSTRKLRATIRIGSKTWAKQIEATIGFAAPSVGG